MNRILLCLILVSLISCNKEIEILPISPKQPIFEYQGFNLGVWCKTCGDVTSNRVSIILDSMKNVGSNTITIDFGVMIDDDGKVILNGIYEPNMNDIKDIIRLSKDKGFKIVLKPHTITNNSTNNRMIYNTPDTTRYNKNIIPEWRNYLVNTIKTLGSDNFNVLCFGTEMDMIDTRKRDEWVTLIDSVRKYYPKGKLTYDAVFNRWDGNPDIKEVVFWDKVDYIGLSLYVPLTKNITPTESELQDSWDNGNRELGDINNVTTYLNDISIKYNKKIYVLETGYKSSNNSLYEVSQQPDKTKSPNYELQTIGMKVLLSNLVKNNNFNGVSIWGVNSTYFMEKDKEWEFVTIGKPANVVIKKYFGVY